MNWCLSTSKFVFKYFEHMSLNIWWVSTNCSCYYYVYCPVGASLSWILNPSDKTLIIFYSLLSSMKRNTPFYRTNSLLHFKWWFNIPQKKTYANILCKMRSTCITFSQDFSNTFFSKSSTVSSHCIFFTIRTDGYMHNWVTFNPLNYFKHFININLKPFRWTKWAPLWC